jgi:ribosomal protein L12E/L44/L45/RPP1/RPP2
MAMMKKLEELLARANRSATAAASVTPTRGAAETDEETDRAATGFLARATRTRSG